MSKNIAVFTTLAMLTSACGESSKAPEPAGPRLAVEFELLENLPRGRFDAAITLVNRGSTALPASGWELFFNFGRGPLPETLPSSVALTHVNGDFYRLAPTEEFVAIEPGTSVRLPFTGRGWLIKEGDAPAGVYLVTADGPAAVDEVIVSPFTSPQQTNRSEADVLPTPSPASRFEENSRLARGEAERVSLIVPTPVRLETGDGNVELDASWEIRYAAGLEGEAGYLAEALEAVLASKPPIAEGGEAAARTVILKTGDVIVGGSRRGSGDEAYRLTVGDGIEIVGTDPAGVFYGIQSLRALLPVASYRQAKATLQVPMASVEDAPRFGYRGLHLDVSRNFQPRATVEKLLELMAFYKLNKFHFHLTDDEGWRLEIPGLPELTTVGARRGHTTDDSEWLMPSFGSGPDPDEAPGSGHFTRSDYVEMLRYATARHIEVIPEIDVPGHARAAIKAMDARHAALMAEGKEAEANEFLLADPDDSLEYRSVQGWDDNVINVCQESTYRFLDKVIREVKAMYAEAGAPFEVLHTGGDEVPKGVWEKSPACSKMIQESGEVDSAHDLAGYFLRRTSDLLSEHGLVTAGWEEIALHEEEHGETTVKVPNEDFVDKGFLPYVWNNVWGWGAEDVGYKLANAGYEVVLSNATNLYFDLAYDKDPREPGYYWAGFVDTRKPYELVPLDLFKNGQYDLLGNPMTPEDFTGRTRLTAAGRRNVLGIQGQIWGENASSPDWMEYLTFPKMLALAERAWAAAPAWAEIEDAEERERQLNAAWSVFAHSLGGRELPRLEYLAGGVHFRLPPPGAVVIDGSVHANVAYPGLGIRYTTDGSDPTPTSASFTGPMEASGTVKLRAFDSRGRGSLVSEVVVE